ncbi:uncharacterized protein LOC119640722 isoform X1 [Glossina fuscipes]|uniref:Uncharacterized protein LOC119640722 isoform X1 n=1 Tax=Glossina fuscipes TaxID=7396 RepID=A0A9C5ZEW2_9MUSC|nr:uncharacterized protein LOC119640722 isoform X1 [Glossina fuscipes]
MDAEMQRMMKIRPLQEAVINYRATVSKYRTIMKKICVSESKSLINVEMTVDDVKLKLPDPQNIPPLTNLHTATNVNILLFQTIKKRKLCSLFSGRLLA